MDNWVKKFSLICLALKSAVALNLRARKKSISIPLELVNIDYEAELDYLPSPSLAQVNPQSLRLYNH